MKISKLFHWLYASVMFLPLLIIPIFAIWSINHDNNQAISLDVSCNKVVEFNQLVSSKNDTLPYEVNGITISSNDDGSYTLNGTSTSQVDFVVYWGYNTITDNKYLVRDYENNSNVSICFNGNLNNRNAILLGGQFNCTLTIASGITFTDYNYKGNLYNLTKMFGAGNEPTYNEFVSFYPNYYEYNIGTTQLLKNYSTETLSNNDIGSQFIYTLYRSCDDYLNFDDVLSLGSISDWIELNVFNGNAPLVYTIVWHYLDYWLILSIFWLCFDVLIYVPQIAHRWLDKASLE